MCPHVSTSLFHKSSTSVSFCETFQECNDNCKREQKLELNQRFNLTVLVQWLIEHAKIIYEQAAGVYEWISMQLQIAVFNNRKEITTSWLISLLLRPITEEIKSDENFKSICFNGHQNITKQLKRVGNVRIDACILKIIDARVLNLTFSVPSHMNLAWN